MIDPSPCQKDISPTILSHHPILQIKKNSILLLLLQKIYFLETFKMRKRLSRASRKNSVTKGKGRESPEHHTPTGAATDEADPKSTLWIWLLVSTADLDKSDSAKD